MSGAGYSAVPAGLLLRLRSVARRRGRRYLAGTAAWPVAATGGQVLAAHSPGTAYPRRGRPMYRQRYLSLPTFVLSLIFTLASSFAISLFLTAPRSSLSAALLPQTRLRRPAVTLPPPAGALSPPRNHSHGHQGIFGLRQSQLPRLEVRQLPLLSSRPPGHPLPPNPPSPSL